MKNFFTEENVKSIVMPVVMVLIIAVSFIMVADICSNTALQIKNKGYLTVKGFAKKEIRSDLGILRATIIVEDADLKVCYAKLDQDKNKVMKYLVKQQGLSDKEIKFEPAGMSEVYKINSRGYNTDQFIKYVLRQDLKIELRDVMKVQKVASDVVAILNDGVKLIIGDPEYFYTRMDDLKIEMIGKATDNARKRALTISKEGRFRVGNIADIRVGIFQITPVNSNEVEDYGINDTSSIDKEIKSVVEVKYFVK